MSRAGEKLKAIRIQLGLSQKQLAKKLGVAESFINEVEQGRKILNESLINKLSKIAGKDINDINMSIEEEVSREDVDIKETSVKVNKANISKAISSEVNDVWNNALSSILKTIPVYKYNLKDTVGSRQLPVMANKIEGYALDKVLYLLIEEDDMIGFRIAKGDIAFAHITHEIENNAICLVEYNSERVIRQIKKLDSNKILLISNKGSLRTETAYIKDINVIAKLDRLEIKL
ncbi:helix-turn-helix domain-containing protein [Clostridium sp. SYSU_GA19001]|uniref:helix-turn-helix transcriptional regulator n=1 Tax=Clostridium caldaquaticum TaxID=2940653 RepID=UPI002076FF3D|nr:helix-turn-helix domain-containing protein [Clostridium caldaquaticum]MCM8711560.1 helix-turn-helix domain-containing protein [Clostridium caldaquaticum]